MKKASLKFIVALSLCLIYNCVGERCAEGIIYDLKINQPIDSVRCEATSGDIEFSDNEGKYSICNYFGGCVPKCPDIEVTFSKVGYKT